MDPRQQRSRSQMSMGHRQEQDGDYEDEDEFYDDEIAHQLGGLSLQELQQREMAHRRAAGGELPVGGMPAQRNFTFNSDRMNNIGRENQVLLQKLQRIAVKGSGQTGSSGYRPLPSSLHSAAAAAATSAPAPVGLPALCRLRARSPLRSLQNLQNRHVP